MNSKPLIRAGLVLLSAGSGCLDILSYRSLGEVFPSAMTGNLALLGRAMGEGNVAAATRNLCAFGGFFAGAIVAAAVLRGSSGKWRLVLALVVQAIVLAAVAWFWEEHPVGAPRFVLIGAAAVGMGMQSAVASRIGMPSVSTTYFTGTTVSIAAGLVSRHGLKRIGWPLLALLFYIVGAGLAGWSTASRGFPPLPVGLPALPAATTLLLAVFVAVTSTDEPRPS